MTQEFFPLLGQDQTYSFSEIHISDRLKNYSFDDSQSLNRSLHAIIQDFHENLGQHIIPYGGYLEKRDIYKVSNHFTDKEVRDIHLGIDVWRPAGSPIFAPQDAVIHSVGYNAAAQDYGWCIILKTKDFHILFGHMSSDVRRWQAGQKIEAGQIIGSLGNEDENGGWEAHLHLQLILDMGHWSGDYPGVCSSDNFDFYITNCPNPAFILLNA